MKKLLLLAFVVTLPACASARTGGTRPLDCAHAGPHLEILPQAIELAPGESLQLRPASRGWSVTPMPEGCRAWRWSTSSPDARIDALGLLSVSARLPVGDTFRVRLENRHGLSVERTARIVALGTNPLVGAWRQDEASGCVGVQGPVRELIFRRSGLYLLTHRPFETQVGERGTYAYNPASGEFIMRGRRGRAGVEEGTLWIEGDFEFALRDGHRPCRAVFRTVPIPLI